MNILLVLIMLFGFTFFTLQSEGSGEVLAPEWPTVSVNGTEGVVAPRNQADDMVWSAEPIEGYWLPGEEWLTQAEDAVALTSAGISVEQRQPTLGGYRQYAGFIVDGERKIYINAMCTEIDGWRTGGVMVMDGGNCFWTAVYNVDSGELESLSVNGDA